MKKSVKIILFIALILSSSIYLSCIYIVEPLIENFNNYQLLTNYLDRDYTIGEIVTDKITQEDHANLIAKLDNANFNLYVNSSLNVESFTAASLETQVVLNISEFGALIQDCLSNVDIAEQLSLEDFVFNGEFALEEISLTPNGYCYILKIELQEEISSNQQLYLTFKIVENNKKILVNQLNEDESNFVSNELDLIDLEFVSKFITKFSQFFNLTINFEENNVILVKNA